MVFRSKSALIILVFLVVAATPVARGQSSAADQPSADSATGQATTPASTPEAPGSLSGTVVDQSGAVVAGAQVKLTSGSPGSKQMQVLQTVSATDGEFFFPSVVPGAFHLSITAQGFAPQTSSGTVHAGETQTLPAIAMTLANNREEVDVSLTQVEVAEEQIKIEEKQRVLGVVPNFYVSYIPDAAPMTAKQKFKLAFRTIIDPFTVFIAASVAGIEQGQNHFAEYGQGAQGYGKRFGASYGDATTGTLIGGAVFPALLRQDPRYFYKGTGTITSRALYAIANSVICKGDNKKWQPNYSNVLGSLASGGISNLYYPEQDRNGLGLTFENAAIGLVATSISNLFQEFIVKKLTPHASKLGQ
jgi:hypothetical protein